MFYGAAWITLLVGLTMLAPNGSLLYVTMVKAGGPYALATVMVGVAGLMFCSKLLPRIRFITAVMGALLWGGFVAFYVFSGQPRPIAAVAAVLLVYLVKEAKQAWSQDPRNLR